MQPEVSSGDSVSIGDGTVKRFTTRRKLVEFYVDEDRFEGIPALPVMSAISLYEIQSKLNQLHGMRKIAAVSDVFEEFLLPESFERFNARLADKSNPIDISTLLEVVQWMLGDAYGLRPTQQPSSSQTGSNDTGTSSTAGAPVEESIPELLVGTAS